MSSERTNEDREFSFRGAASRRSDYRRREGGYRSRSPPPRGGGGQRWRHDDHRRHQSSRGWAPRDHPHPSPYNDRWGWDDLAPLYSSGEGYSDPTPQYDEPEEPPASNGDSDMARDDEPWQVLLLRGLKTNVEESTLVKGLEKLYLDDSNLPSMPPAMPLPSGMPPRPPMPAGATPQSLKRVFLIRDRVTHRSLGFGFAEYHSVTDAKAAMAKAKTLGTSCTISSKQFEVCYPHLGIFHQAPLNSRETQNFGFEFKSGQQFLYHDQRYYAKPLVVNADSPTKSESPAPEANTATAKKRTKTDTLDNPSAPPVKKAKKQPHPLAMQAQRAEAKARGMDGEAEANDPPNSNSNANPPFRSGDIDSLSTTGASWQQSFAFDGERDGKKLICCFLCNQSFLERIDKLEPHVERSATHAAKYENDAKFQQGLERMKASNVGQDETLKVVMKPQKTRAGLKSQQKPQQEPQQVPPQVQQPVQTAPAAPQYRDRAAQRREEEAEAARLERASKPAGTTAAKPAFKAISLKGAMAKGNSQQTKNNSNSISAPPPSVGGIGMKMLKNAGWKEGQGLGNGNGITALIEQSVYAAGVGLGHESSKQGDAIEEANRQTRNDRGDFAEKTKESARKRFEELD